ncbi:hypothetical protein [Pseudoxanthomonas sp. UTMC 1351]|uniref:hypothetical protein n=1 Tax=Pseudoxanthomonas sp. UTMC 1351 TaxID=2695853 RepID=UPI0034D01DE4
MIKKVLAVLALQIPALSLAGVCDPAGCTGKVKTLYPHGSTGHVYIDMDADNKSVLNCTLSQGVFITLRETNKRHAEIYSMLLTASVMGKDVRVRIIEGTPDCELIYTMLSS